MTDLLQFRDFILRPALERLEPAIPWTLAAEQLVLGTCLHESDGLTYVDQLAAGPGPAFGLAQMERATHDDLWKTFIPYQTGLRGKLLSIAGNYGTEFPPVEELHGNNFYACAMCRVFYRRVPAALPAEGDALGMAYYWKRYYNTGRGKGTVKQALPKFQMAISLGGSP